MLKYSLLLALCATLIAGQGRQLIRPDPQACAQRTKHSATFRNGHYYFFSWAHRPTANHERDWLDARNICRKHCQDLVSLETVDEAEFIHQAISSANVKYIWTSGRKCNFPGCDRPDLQPPLTNGWFWSGSEARLPSTRTNDPINAYWSTTGGAGTRQPDNREQSQNGPDEACIAVLNNFYNDGVKWHDIACNHLKPWVCEDSDSLLAFARATYRNVNIP
ncbi:hypothetical protein Avbf_16145 [Armadillidium vulgare]|nr:hypothetical protein Avbf_16145 [Armadillidium vulgare]